MARPTNPNDIDQMKLIKTFFSKLFNREHSRYVDLEFHKGSEQELIEQFKTKLLLSKDMGLSFMKQIGIKEEDAKFIIKHDPLAAYLFADGELKEVTNIRYAEVDISLSNKEILEIIKKERNLLKENNHIFFQRTNTKELSTKLADALYIFDCKKFYLSNSFISEELAKYYGYTTNIKDSTIKKYFENTLEIYETL